MAERFTFPVIGAHERQVLDVLGRCHGDDMNCLNFKGLSSPTGLNRTQVKRAARRLARKGYAAHQTGLFNDDGEVAGSGYCCTDFGRKALDIFERDERAQQREAG